MKKVICTCICISITVALFAANLDDYDVQKQSDVSAFQVGGDNDTGRLYYIVDRKCNLCFALHQWAKNSNLVSIDCDKIKKIKPIKEYIEKGKLPD